jgi:hypothetical protein
MIMIIIIIIWSGITDLRAVAMRPRQRGDAVQPTSSIVVVTIIIITTTIIIWGGITDLRALVIALQHRAGSPQARRRQLHLATTTASAFFSLSLVLIPRPYFQRVCFGPLPWLSLPSTGSDAARLPTDCDAMRHLRRSKDQIQESRVKRGQKAAPVQKYCHSHSRSTPS